ncbi:MAG: type II secretion system protein [Planctomycetota bacterium]
MRGICHRRSAKTRGFTLLEVILALAILGIALATLGQAVGRSHRSARRVAVETQLAFVAESVLEELTTGLRPLTAVDREAIADPGDSASTPIALVTVQVDSGPFDGLLAVRVTAMPNDPAATNLEAVRLTRWIVDPSLEESASSSSGETL